MTMGSAISIWHGGDIRILRLQPESVQGMFIERQRRCPASINGKYPPKSSKLLDRTEIGGGMLRAVPIVCLLLFSGACLERIATTRFPAAFDELEHVSYAAYLQETGRLQPRFEEQRTLSPGDLS